MAERLVMSVEQFRSAMSNLGSIPSRDNLPAPFTWERNQIELRRHALRNDPNGFLTWSTVQAPMHIAHFTDRVKDKLQELRDDDWERWEPAVLTVGFGDSEPLSANLVNQAYHLMRWERSTGRNLADMRTIVEFGGGYGAMALVVYRLGFIGDYWIYDLPELSILQQFFLGHHDVWNVRYVTGNVEVLPEWCDLFIGLYSLSEAPLKVRHEFSARVCPTCWLVCYQPEFGGVDNIVYFDMLMEDILHNKETVYHGTYIFA